MEIYDVERNGELTPLTGKLSACLSTERVLIITIDRNKTIYLWKGIQSPVAKKFIGARCAQQIRGQKGLLYKVIPIDEGEEPPEFEEIKDLEPSQVSISGELKTEIAVSKPTLSEDLKNLLLNEELDSGFTREGIIVGNDYYAVIESKATVLGKEVINREIEKTENLPDGLLFDENYGIRVHVDSNGKVDAVEILRRK
ncbi:MAG: hypothetical protein ACTSRP_02845 [Candidatus Helarchaeota archaeon]